MVEGANNIRRQTFGEHQYSYQSSGDISHCKLILDLAGHIIRCDKNAESIFGYPSDTILAKTIHQLLPQELTKWKSHLQALRKGKTVTLSWHTEEQNGSEFTRFYFMSASLTQKRPTRTITTSIFASSIPIIGSIEKCQRLAAIIQSSDDAIIGKTLDGVITSWNKAAEKLYGYSEKEAVGQPINLIVPDSKKVELQEIMHQLRKGNSIEHLETQRITKQGGELDISLSISPIKDQDGNLTGASAIARDITEKKQLEKDFQQNVARNQAILDNVSEAIITITNEGVIKSFNKAAERIFGYNSSEIIDQNINLLFKSRRELVFQDHLKSDSTDPDNTANERELQGKRKDGSTFPIKASCNNVHINGQLSFFCVITDLTNQRKLEQRIVEIREMEQLHLASYLHDDVGQTLSGLRLMSLNLGRILESNELEVAGKVHEMSELIRQVDEELRDLARGFLASKIDTNSLRNALKQLKIKSEKIYNIHCKLKIKSNTAIKEETTIQHVYRITQEAIRNAVIHGKADEINIFLEERGNNLRLEIMDNGIGFSEYHKPFQDVDHGISTMKYRAHLLGGQLDLFEMAKGIKLSCIFPIF